MACAVLVVLLLSITIGITSVSGSQSPVFIDHPKSIAAVDGSTVVFTCSCTATDSGDLVFRVNETYASLETIIDKGFKQSDGYVVRDGTKNRNLSCTALAHYNNTMIYCRADSKVNNAQFTDSNTAILKVQGHLSSVADLSYSFVNYSTINISWSPPFTLPGTNITGYNISATSNGTTTNYFTSDSYYVLLLTDITDSLHNGVIIAVSGYNGLNGVPNTLTEIFFQQSPTQEDTSIENSFVDDSSTNDRSGGFIISNSWHEPGVSTNIHTIADSESPHPSSPITFDLKTTSTIIVSGLLILCLLLVIVIISIGIYKKCRKTKKVYIDRERQNIQPPAADHKLQVVEKDGRNIVRNVHRVQLDGNKQSATMDPPSLRFLSSLPSLTKRRPLRPIKQT